MWCNQPCSGLTESASKARVCTLLAAVDAVPETTIEVSLGMIHVLALLSLPLLSLSCSAINHELA